MKITDLVAFPPADRVSGTFRRLSPLAQGNRYAALVLPARHVFVAVEWLGETQNGGLRQYFSNSSGDRWADARFALDTLGVGQATFARAVAVFPGGLPPSHPLARARATLDDAIGAALDALDDAIERGPLVDAVARYIVQHRDALAFIDRYPSGLKALDLEDDPAAFADFVRGADAEDVESAFVIVTWAAFLWRGTARLTEPQRRFLVAFDVLDEASCDGITGYQRTAAANPVMAADVLEELGATGLAAAVRAGDDEAVQPLRIDTAKALARAVKAMMAR
jgi:hypothetical protein